MCCSTGVLQHRTCCAPDYDEMHCFCLNSHHRHSLNLKLNNDLSVLSSSQLEFIDTADMTVMNSGEHLMVSDVEWDPTGRYLVSIVSWWAHKVSLVRRYVRTTYDLIFETILLSSCADRQRLLGLVLSGKTAKKVSNGTAVPVAMATASPNFVVKRANQGTVCKLSVCLMSLERYQFRRIRPRGCFCFDWCMAWMLFSSICRTTRFCLFLMWRLSNHFDLSDLWLIPLARHKLHHCTKNIVLSKAEL